MTDVRVQTDCPTITVERVESLYARFRRMDIKTYYKEGQRNPYKGLVDVIPETAKVYTLIHERDIDNIEIAQRLLKGVGGRKKIRQALKTKAEINYQMFSPGGKILILYV